MAMSAQGDPITEFEFADRLAELLAGLQSDIMRPLNASLQQIAASETRAKTESTRVLEEQSCEANERLKDFRQNTDRETQTLQTSRDNEAKSRDKLIRHIRNALNVAQGAHTNLKAAFQIKGLEICPREAPSSSPLIDDAALDSMNQQGGLAFQQIQQLLTGPLAHFKSSRVNFDRKLIGAAFVGLVTCIVLTHQASAEWSDPIWRNWQPDPSPEFAARLGKLILEDSALAKELPELNLKFELPALMPFADGRFLLFESKSSTRPFVLAIQSLMLRALANVPPGKLRFTFIDPVGLGQSVAPFMALGDLDEQLISGRAWSEAQHIEQQLGKLTEHMESPDPCCRLKVQLNVPEVTRELKMAVFRMVPYRIRLGSGIPCAATCEGSAAHRRSKYRIRWINAQFFSLQAGSIMAVRWGAQPDSRVSLVRFFIVFAFLSVLGSACAALDPALDRSATRYSDIFGPRFQENL